MLRQFMMYLIGAFGFLAFFILAMVLLVKLADQTNPWLRAYSRRSISEGYRLKMEVKGKPWVVELLVPILVLFFVILDILTGTWDLIAISIVVGLIMFYWYKYPTTYICCLYSDSILIGIMNIPRIPDRIMEIPLSEIVSIDNRISPVQHIKTTYLSTFSNRLNKYKAIYILCQHENKQRYFKIRVTDEILERLRRHLTNQEDRVERVEL